MFESRYDNAVSMARAGCAKEAIRELELLANETCDLDRRLAIIADIARIYEDMGEYDHALNSLRRSQEISVTESQKLYTEFIMACNRALKGDHALALNQYNSILQKYARLLNSDDERDLLEDIAFRRAMVLANMGNYNEAIRLLCEAVSFTTLSIEQRQTAHLWLGICYDKIDQLDNAKEAYLCAIAIDHKTRSDTQARYNLARLYAIDGAWAQAKMQLETILNDCIPDSTAMTLASIYERLSITCRQLGDQEKANYYARLGKKQ